MYDFETDNQSFLDMQRYLCECNINNNKFMLILYDEGLKDVDPYDPNLTLKQKSRIIKECSINIWYFLRAVVKLPMEGNGTIRFKLDRANCAQIYCITKNFDSWMSKPRQLRKTIDTLCITNYIRLFHGFEESIRLSGTDLTSSKYMLEKMKKLTSVLPDYIQNLNTDKFKCVYTDSPRVKNIIQAENLGRSYSNTFFHFQDAEYIPYILDIYKAMIPVYTSCKKLCISKGLYSSILFESVFNDNHPEIEQFLASILRWKDIFYDYTDEELKSLVENNYNMVYIYNTYQELGMDKDWFNKQCIILNGDKDTIRREILLKRKSEIED